jgi:hypothetical protein
VCARSSILATLQLVGGNIEAGAKHAEKAMQVQVALYSENQQGALCAVQEGLHIAGETKSHRSLFHGHLLHAQLGKNHSM